MPEGIPLDGVFTLRFFLWVVVPVLWCVAGVTIIHVLDLYYGNTDGQFGASFRIKPLDAKNEGKRDNHVEGSEGEEEEDREEGRGVATPTATTIRGSATVRAGTTSAAATATAATCTATRPATRTSVGGGWGGRGWILGQEHGSFPWRRKSGWSVLWVCAHGCVRAACGFSDGGESALLALLVKHKTVPPHADELDKCIRASNLDAIIPRTNNHTALHLLVSYPCTPDIKKAVALYLERAPQCVNEDVVARFVSRNEDVDVEVLSLFEQCAVSSGREKTFADNKALYAALAVPKKLAIVAKQLGQERVLASFYTLRDFLRTYEVCQVLYSLFGLGVLGSINWLEAIFDGAAGDLIGASRTLSYACQLLSVPAQCNMLRRGAVLHSLMKLREPTFLNALIPALQSEPNLLLLQVHDETPLEACAQSRGDMELYQAVAKINPRAFTPGVLRRVCAWNPPRWDVTSYVYKQMGDDSLVPVDLFSIFFCAQGTVIDPHIDQLLQLFPKAVVTRCVAHLSPNVYGLLLQENKTQCLERLRALGAPFSPFPDIVLDPVRSNRITCRDGLTLIPQHGYNNAFLKRRDGKAFSAPVEISFQPSGQFIVGFVPLSSRLDGSFYLQGKGVYNCRTQPKAGLEFERQGDCFSARVANGKFWLRKNMGAWQDMGPAGGEIPVLGLWASARLGSARWSRDTHLLFSIDYRRRVFTLLLAFRRIVGRKLPVDVLAIILNTD